MNWTEKSYPRKGFLANDCLAQTPHREVFGVKDSHNRPTRKSVARKTRAIAPPRSLWRERLAQSAHREVFGAKDSRKRPIEKSVERKTRTISPTESLWLERLAQSAHRKVCGAKDSRNQPTGKSVARKTRTIIRHGSVSACCPPQAIRDFMGDSQPKAFYPKTLR